METLVPLAVGTVLGMVFAYPVGMVKGFRMVLYLVQEDVLRITRNRDNTISVEPVEKD